MTRIVIEIRFDEDVDPLTIEHMKAKAREFCDVLDASYTARGVRTKAWAENNNKE